MALEHTDRMPRQERGQQRRRQLLDATLALIGREGVDAVSHRRVAQLADVPLGSTTYYFASREDMLVQALSYFVELELESLRERFVVPGTAGARPEELAEEFVAVLAPQLGSDRERTIAQYTLFTEAARRPELHEVMHEWNDAWWGVLAPLFADLGAAEPEIEARAFLAMLDGLLLAQLAAPDPTFEDAVLRPALTRWFARVAAERESNREGE